MEVELSTKYFALALPSCNSFSHCCLRCYRVLVLDMTERCSILFAIRAVGPYRDGVELLKGPIQGNLLPGQRGPVQEQGQRRLVQEQGRTPTSACVSSRAVPRCTLLCESVRRPSVLSTSRRVGVQPLVPRTAMRGLPGGRCVAPIAYMLL